MKNDKEIKPAEIVLVNYLSRYVKTEKEAVEYLKKKGYKKLEIDVAIEKAKKYGYINDARYAENFIETKRNAYGAKLIRFKLMQKGISEDIMQRLFNKSFEDYSSMDIKETPVYSLLEKHIRNKEINQKTKQSAFRFLVSRGFSLNVVNKAVSEMFKNMGSGKCE